MTADKVFLSEELSSPVSSIERQHQELVAHINDILRRADRGPIENYAEEIGAFIDKLTEHFHDEEKIMEKAGYPGFEWHCHHHAQSLSRIEDTLKRCRRRGNADKMDFMRLHDTVTLDVARADVKFYEYLVGTNQIGLFTAGH